MPRVDAIDISHWQEGVDFATVARSGVLGVIHKCTEGTSYLDERYAERQQEAMNNGFPFGAYHFLKHGRVQEQMGWFVECANLPAGSRAVIDYEDEDCTLEDLKEAIEELGILDPSLEICVYAGGLLKGQVSPNAEYPWLAKTSLWLAQYGPTPEWPTNIWDVYSLWQFSDKGSVPGVDGDCDVNQFNGSQEQCLAWFGPEQPEPEPPEATIFVDIRTPEGIGVVVNVNDEPVAKVRRRRWLGARHGRR